MNDYMLAKAITSGCWIKDNTRNGIMKRLPIEAIITRKINDCQHQTFLKKCLADYYDIYHGLRQIPPRQMPRWNGKITVLRNIIRKMNQYRQKHWYWEAIN